MANGQEEKLKYFIFLRTIMQQKIKFKEKKYIWQRKIWSIIQQTKCQGDVEVESNCPLAEGFSGHISSISNYSLL